eukprot:9531220-Karenia_brevis.AAC.1
MSDKRSLKEVQRLQVELKNVRHAITRSKPAQEQVTILESALAKKRSELQSSFQQRDQLNDTIAQLKVDINAAE